MELKQLAKIPAGTRSPVAWECRLPEFWLMESPLHSHREKLLSRMWGQAKHPPRTFTLNVKSSSLPFSNGLGEPVRLVSSSGAGSRRRGEGGKAAAVPLCPGSLQDWSLPIVAVHFPPGLGKCKFTKYQSSLSSWENWHGPLAVTTQTLPLMSTDLLLETFNCIKSIKHYYYEPSGIKNQSRFCRISNY